MSFSCLISCYKNDDPIQLSKCLDSLLDQTLKADEIVFVKDGPLNNNLENILKNYSNKLPFKFIELPNNLGLGNALNIGLLKCENEIVFRMDTDDICLPNRFEKQYKFMLNNPDIDIVGAWAYDIDKNDEIIGERKYPCSHVEIFKLLWANPLIHPLIGYKKNKIIEIGSYDIKLKRKQDYELWIRSAYNGLKFANVDDFLLKYRFTDTYYKKNSTKLALEQALLGYNGSKMLRLPVFTRLAVFVPVLRSILPKSIIEPAHKLMSKFDPRKKI